MDIGVFIRYGKALPGREEKAIELFGEVVGYCESKLATGEITFFEPFLFVTGDAEEETGFILVKGPSDKIYSLFDEDDYRKLVAKAHLLVEHFKWDLITYGEAVFTEMERFNETLVELGLN